MGHGVQTSGWDKIDVVATRAWPTPKGPLGVRGSRWEIGRLRE